MNPHVIAITAHLASINRRRQELVAAQEADNAEFRANRIPGREFMKRWHKRQQERIALETRYFWLLVSLEEIENETATI